MPVYNRHDPGFKSYLPEYAKDQDPRSLAHLDLVCAWLCYKASRWRAEPRPFRGVAHGLFVFTCLSAYFESIADLVGAAGRAHVLKRIQEIREEIETIRLEDLTEGLTPTGTTLARRWSSVVL